MEQYLLLILPIIVFILTKNYYKIKTLNNFKQQLEYYKIFFEQHNFKYIKSTDYSAKFCRNEGNLDYILIVNIVNNKKLEISEFEVSICLNSDNYVSMKGFPKYDENGLNIEETLKQLEKRAFNVMSYFKLPKN